MSGLTWKRFAPADHDGLEAFLRSREKEAAGFIGRLLREGRLRPPSPLRGALVLAVEDWAGSAEVGSPEGDAAAAAAAVVAGAILKTPTGLVFPLLPAAQSQEPGERIPRALGQGVSSVIGPAPDVERFESALRLKPLVAVSYDLMSRPVAQGRLPPRAVPRGLATRPASIEDLEELVPLQEAYEKEEVLTAIHDFDEAGSRAALARALRDQVIFVSRLGEAAVAKAGTNARAFGLDQIGGVFVAPPYRHRGIGAVVVSRLLEFLAQQGRGAVLFVKRGNEAARGLYDDLDFEVIGGYRADYFVP
jgi:predicted GNAT family acetyltransferase